MKLKSETYKGHKIEFAINQYNEVQAIVLQNAGTNWETKAPTKQEAFDYMKNLIDFMVEKNEINKKYSKEQIEAIRELITAERIGHLNTKENRQYYADKLDKLKVPYKIQNKAVFLSQEYPNKYINQIIDEVIK